MKNFKFIFIFIFVFLIYYLINYNMMFFDPINNYAFSYGILRGEVPYLDFNTVTTPLFAFFMVPFLAIYNHVITFMIVSSLLVTVMFYLLYKMYDKKSYLMFMSFLILNFFGILPTYNLLCLFLLVVILYLEKNHNNKDYLIGAMIAFAILSKHTVGCFFIIPSIVYYYKDLKKLFKRFVGFIIPCFIFLIYLIFTKSFFAFLDLCVFGLFDFSKNNHHLLSFYLVICLLMFIINIIVCIKDKDIINFYLLFTISFSIPLFDLYHLALCVDCFSILIFKYVKIKDRFIYLFSILPVVFLCTAFLSVYKNIGYRFSYYDHFKYTFYDYRSEKIFKFIDSYDDPLILSYWKGGYDISRNHDVDNYLVFLYGNNGFHGNDKLIKDIKGMKKRYVLIDTTNYNDMDSRNQFNKVVCDYVMKHYKFIEEKNGFLVYFIE